MDAPEKGVPLHAMLNSAEWYRVSSLYTTLRESVDGCFSAPAFRPAQASKKHHIASASEHPEGVSRHYKPL
jgi:hypothetical protein